MFMYVCMYNREREKGRERDSYLLTYLLTFICICIDCGVCGWYCTHVLINFRDFNLSTFRLGPCVAGTNTCLGCDDVPFSGKKIDRCVHRLRAPIMAIRVPIMAIRVPIMAVRVPIMVQRIDRSVRAPFEAHCEPV